MTYSTRDTKKPIMENLQHKTLLDNSFWQYSLIVYKQQGCAEFLLDAQNRFGLDVNVLLFIGWLAQQEKTLELSAEFESAINHFQQGTVRPIREIRITAKGFNNLEFYEELKRLELAAENIEQQRLYRLSNHMPASNTCLEESIEQSFKVYTGQNDKDVDIIHEKNWLQTLIQHLQPGYGL